MNFIYTSGKRIDSRLVYAQDKQLYKTKGANKYVCYQEDSGCKARLLLNPDNMTCRLVPKHNVHNHEGHQEELHKQFNEEKKVKLECQMNTEKKLTDIFKSEVGTPGLSYKKLKSTMVYNRQKKIPPNPTTVDEAIAYFETEEIKSLVPSEGDSSMIVQQIVRTEHYAFVIYASPNILTNLPEMRWFHITSSMKVVSNAVFKVLVTVAIIKDTESFPCSERDKNAYRQAFEMIEEKWNLHMANTWIDYDLALRNALANIYPLVVFNAFWYQYCYAIRRKCKLIDQFYESVYVSNASHIFHQTLCLPLLGPTKITEGVALMKKKCGIFPPMNDMLNILDQLLHRDGLQSVCIDLNRLGESCSLNHNETLKTLNITQSANCSLFYLVQLLKTEDRKIAAKYGSNIVEQKKESLQTSKINRPNTVQYRPLGDNIARGDIEQGVMSRHPICIISNFS